MRKVRMLDEKYGGEERATQFQEALQSFGGGELRLFVIGAYGEVNDEKYLLLKVCESENVPNNHKSTCNKQCFLDITKR